MDNRNFRNEISAVSPVIGVILMVAITVILSVVIGSYVFGSAVNVEKSYIVGTSVEQVTANEVRVMVHGGLDSDKLQYINVSIGGIEFRRTNVNNTNAEAYPVTGLNFPALGTPSGSSTVPIGTPVMLNATMLSPGRDHVVMVATFMDGTRQVILDTHV
jgi:flagellin-like protein